jgi:hypothetical protein
MRPQNSYYRFINVAVIAVLLWNIVGWLGFGLVLNHAHKHHEKAHCEIALCTCEVEEGEKICTCHHNELQHNTEHKDDHHGSFCYYSNPHSSSGNSLQILIPVTNFNAAEFDETIRWSPPAIDLVEPADDYKLPSGMVPDLLRPPRA